MTRMNPYDIESTFKAVSEFEPNSKIMQEQLATLRDHLTAQPVQPEPKKLWRTIMLNKWTQRTSAAAVLLISISLIYTFFINTKLTVAELLTQSAQNLDKLTWIKNTSHRYIPDQNAPVNRIVKWIDVSNKRTYVNANDTHLSQMDYQTQEWISYDAKTNTTIIKELDTWVSPSTDILGYLDKIQAEGLEVTRTHKQLEDHSVIIIEYTEVLIDLRHTEKITNTSIAGQSVKTIHYKITIRQHDLLPETIEKTYQNHDGQIITIECTQGEYVNAGPKNITDLGVPPDAKIINKIPAREVKETFTLIDQNRKVFPNQYTAVITNSPIQDGKENMISAQAVFVQDRQQRVDTFANRFEWPDPITPHCGSKIAASKELVESLWKSDTKPGIASVRLYDGLWLYIIEANNRHTEFKARERERRPEGEPCVNDDIVNLGWTELWNLNDNPAQLKQDAYASQHDLLVLEKSSQGDGISLPHRQRIYVDPNRDYLTHRYVREKLLDAPWQEDQDWLSKDKAETTPFFEEVFDQTITEYGQTSEGRWYPKMIKISWLRRSHGRESNHPRIIRIHLIEEYPEFPEGLFDPNNLPKPSPTDASDQ